jgi:hypothetical protein
VLEALGVLDDMSDAEAIALGFIIILVLVLYLVMSKKGKDMGGARHKLIRRHNAFYSINGKEISCSLCGERHFRHKAVLMNSSIATFLGFDWANRQASALACSECGHILWFMQQPEDESTPNK